VFILPAYSSRKLYQA